jgi:hypothetical protein
MSVEETSVHESEDPGKETLDLLTSITRDPAMAQELTASIPPPDASSGDQPTSPPFEQLELFDPDQIPTEPLRAPKPSRDAPTIHDLPGKVGEKHLTLADVAPHL